MLTNNRSIERTDVQHENLLVNGDFENVSAFINGQKPWSPWQVSWSYVASTNARSLYARPFVSPDGSGQASATTARYSLQVSCSTKASCASTGTGATQEIVIAKPSSEPIMVSGWSRATNVTGVRDSNYALYLDVYYQDGTLALIVDAVHFACSSQSRILTGILHRTASVPVTLSVPFNVGTHEWEYQMAVFQPTKPVKRVFVLLLFRQHFGTVEFDDVRVSQSRTIICQSLRLLAAMQSGVDEHRSIPAELAPSRRLFLLVWDRPASQFGIEHRLLLESLFVHHKDGVVRILSNTLPITVRTAR